MTTEKMENLKEVIEWIICIVVAIILALVVRHYVFTPTVVRQVSMKPTMQQGDRLILDRWSITRKKDIKRGEIITFEAPSNIEITEDVNTDNPIAVYEGQPTTIFSKFIYYVLEYNKTSYIKRVIGLAGDKIKIESGKVYVNDEQLEESYLQNNVYTEGGVYYNITVPEGYIYVMGDNRPQSVDSRIFGCIPIDKVESKVLIRFWPFNEFGKV